MKLRVAIAQVDPAVGDIRKNVDLHVRVIERAIRAKAGLIVFPELSLTGYSLRDLVWDVAVDPTREKALDPLRRQSRRISIALGLVENGGDFGMYNAGVFLEDGNVRHIHRKVYPPTYGMFEEGRYFSPGTAVRAFDSKHGRFGLAVCEDFWHLSVPYLLALDGAEALISLTASPTRLGGPTDEMSNANVNLEHLRSYARLLSTYVLFANRVGIEDGVNFWGGSALIDPFGQTLAQARFFVEDLIVGTLDSNEIRRARRFSRHVLDERPEIAAETIRRIIEGRHRA